MKCLIYLMRHGHIETHKCMVGQSNLPLSSLGSAQAKYWQDKFQSLAFERVYVSPLQRAVQTAEIVLGDKCSNFLKIDEFSEISLGNWEGKNKDEIMQNDSLLWGKRGEDFYHFPPPNGESFFDLEKRVLPKFHALCSDIKQNFLFSKTTENIGEERKFLIVAHQAVNRIILSHVQALEEVQLFEIPQDYACVNLLELGESVRFVQQFTCPVYQ